MTLSHANPDCVGLWRYEHQLVATADGHEAVPHLVCDTCGTAWQCTYDTMEAAIEQNWLGVCMENLADEGAALLRGEVY